MTLPDAETLLRLYYGLQFSIPFILLTALFGILIVYIIGFQLGFRYALKEAWEKGIPHTQKQHNKLYLKWKYKIGDND